MKPLQLSIDSIKHGVSEIHFFLMDTFYVIGAINSTDYSLLEILYGFGLSGIIPDFLSTTGASSQSPCVPFLELLSLTSLVGLLHLRGFSTTSVF